MTEFVLTEGHALSGTSVSTGAVTLSGSNLHLIVYVACTSAPSSVTFGGSSMSFLREDSSGAVMKLRAYELDNPPTTSNAVATATWGSGQAYMAIAGLAYTDIDSVRNSSGANATTQSVAHDATTVSGDHVVSAGLCGFYQTNPCYDTTTFTVNHSPNAGQTEKTQYNLNSTDGNESSGVGFSISYELATSTSTSSGQNLAVTIDGSCLDPVGYNHAVGAVVLIPATGGGTEVSLTGTEITSSQGALSVSLSSALTGIAITSAQGTLSPVQTGAITGQEITSAQGNVGVNVSVPLTGIAITASQGTIGPNTGTNVELTGIEIASAQGSLGVTASAALIGTAITSSQGTVSPASSSSSLSNPQATATHNGWINHTIDYTP